MSEIELWIDQRERFIIPIFDALDPKKMPPYKLELKTLSAGDYAVVYKDHIIMLIERKSWQDLAATFLDRSRKFNYEKMIAERQKFGCRLFYLVEGKRPAVAVHHVTIDALEAHLDHLLFDHDIVTIYSHGADHTPERLFNLIKHYMTAHSNPFKALEEKLAVPLPPPAPVQAVPVDPLCIFNFGEVPIINTVSAADSLKSVKRLSDEAINYALWNSIEGVTELTYTALKDINVSLIGLLCGQYSVPQLMHAKYRLGTLVGEKKLGKIVNSAISPLTHIKVLTQIPSISENRAKIILSQYNIQQIALGSVTEQQLADIIIISGVSPTQSNTSSVFDKMFEQEENLSSSANIVVNQNSRRLGNAAAKNIVKYLTVQNK